MANFAKHFFHVFATIMSDTSSFYHRLAAHDDFLAITEPSNYTALPQDWFVIITDVINSTEAIEQGKYKDVNTAGALAAIALANALGTLDFPFVFGGDGITALLPPVHISTAQDVLASTRAICKEMFGLQLRVGIIPMKTLVERGFEVYVLRFRISERAQQAILLGSGVDAAEALVKDPITASLYLLPEEFTAQSHADFSGYMCGWQDVPSPKGETISLIVKPLEQSIDAVEQRLFAILTEIHKICGNAHEHHPLSATSLSTTFALASAEREAKILYHNDQPAQYRQGLWNIWVRNIQYVLLRNPKMQEDRTGTVRDADFRKFDGSLKMVLSCTNESRTLLSQYFDSLYRQGVIAYGMHVSDKAVITCFLKSATSHIHFIDAADGGYALAAKQLKQQLKKLQSDSL